MASVGTYLNFANQTEAAFTFYQSIFGGEFEGGIRRFGDMPPTRWNAPSSRGSQKSRTACIPAHQRGPQTHGI